MSPPTRRTPGAGDTEGTSNGSSGNQNQEQLSELGASTHSTTRNELGDDECVTDGTGAHVNRNAPISLADAIRIATERYEAAVTPTCPCGVVIDDFRSDARFCSNACRQRAYRQRQKVVSP